jgi:hypothetical protein
MAELPKDIDPNGVLGRLLLLIAKFIRKVKIN